MFGRHYFGGRHFAPRYFGSGVSEAVYTTPYYQPEQAVPAVISAGMLAAARRMNDDLEVLMLLEKAGQSGLFDAMREEH